METLINIVLIMFVISIFMSDGGLKRKQNMWKNNQLYSRKFNALSKIQKKSPRTTTPMRNIISCNNEYDRQSKNISITNSI